MNNMNYTRKTAALLAAAMLSAASVTAFAEEITPSPSSGNGGNGGKGTSVTITIDAQKDGAFLIVPQEITVVSGKAEEYGFTDSDDGVTYLDALVTMHELKFGDEFTPDTVGDHLTLSGGWITTAFKDANGYATGSFINGIMPSETVDKTILSDNDIVEFYFYQDLTNWSDCYTAFSTASVSATAGKPVELTLNMHQNIMATFSDPLIPLNAGDGMVTLSTVNDDGSLSPALTDNDSELIMPDENGNVTLVFDEPGEYIVTASGFIPTEVYSYLEQKTVVADSPITAPYCFVTVEPQYTLENINIKASAIVKKAEGAEEAKVILAAYDKDGVLIGSETKDAVNGNVSFDMNIPNDSIVKMFIWDDVSGMKPYTSVK